MFWSTYKLDPQGKMHVGKSDLKTGNVIKDVAIDPGPESKRRREKDAALLRFRPEQEILHACFHGH